MLLAVEAAEVPPDFPLAPGYEELEEPERPPRAPRKPRPPRLSGLGETALRQALQIEGEMVHAWRIGPDGPPQAWRWTDEEIERLVPALEYLAERYGVTEVVNTQGPLAVAGLTMLGHVSRSVAEERRWRRDQRLAETATAFPMVDFETEPAPAPAPTEEPDDVHDAAAANGEPGPGLDRAALDRLAGDLFPGFRGGPE